MSSPAEKSKLDDTTTQEDGKGVKRSAPDSTSENNDVPVPVHSANEWENASIDGGGERKSKFLRLMGAARKEHHGRFVIGETESAHSGHGLKADTTGELAEGIEAQFRQSLDHKQKSGFRGHMGFGFVKEPPNPAPAPAAEGATVNDNTGEGQDSSEAQGKEQPDQQEAPLPPPPPPPPPPSEGTTTSPQPDSSSASTPSRADKYKKMAFVKSSS